MTDIMYYDSPLGRLVAAQTDGALTGLWFAGQKYFMASLKDDMEIREITQYQRFPVLEQAKDWLDRYFHGEKPSVCGLPLAPSGSPFRQEVWKILREIPYGEVTTYGAIARQIAASRGSGSMSAQAVGNAVGRNPVSIMIPCHRVIGSGGNLTGYAGGIDKKIRLLTLEGVDMSDMYVPEIKNSHRSR